MIQKINQYGLLGIIKMLINLIRTKLTFQNARIIRFPIDIRGKKFIQVSKGFTTGVGCRIEAYPKTDKKVLFFGENFQMNDYVHITAMECVKIGKNVLLASKIYINESNSHQSLLLPLISQFYKIDHQQISYILLINLKFQMQFLQELLHTIHHAPY